MINVLLAIPAAAASLAFAVVASAPVAVVVIAAIVLGAPVFGASSIAGQGRGRGGAARGTTESVPESVQRVDRPREPQPRERLREVAGPTRSLIEPVGANSGKVPNGLSGPSEPPESVDSRQLLRRDLHDGLGPVLASATMRADVARTMVATDPDAATQMLMQLRDDLRMAVSDVRRLARQLELQTLDGVGLGSALRKQARRFEQAGGGRLRITVAGPPPRVKLPNSVEVALYRIASEALTNVVRHAAARQCVVRLSVDEAIRLEVVDDGVGLPSRVSEGVGFDSMRERAREFGGDCRVMPSRPRGTRVLASLPLRRSA